MKSATIVGAGLVGSLWAVYLSKAGFTVTVVERRPDIRKAEISAGKSINLALSDRGWKALDTVGIGDKIREIAIPMYGRMMHDPAGKLSYQPYGREGQAIYSVSRGELNARMMTIAENVGHAEILYNEKCENVDLENGIVYLKNVLTNKQSEIKSDLVFATDGAFSTVRYHSMQKLDRFSCSQQYIEDGYREILLPANKEGNAQLKQNALHIWPRGRFMLIALPNEDESFTCTLFMPFEKHKNSFENLKTRDQVNKFFKTTFPDFFELMPNVADAWEDHPLSSLALIRCFPWTRGKTALMGDAAHATVPFFGQGMNSGFEDCTKMWNLMQRHQEDWDTVFKTYEISRKPNCDSMQNLSLQNYHVMRDRVANPEFLLQKKLERKMQEFYPEDYVPLYSMVTFSDMDYAKAEKKGEEQNKQIKKIMNLYDIEALFESGEIDDLIHQFFIHLTQV